MKHPATAQMGGSHHLSASKPSLTGRVAGRGRKRQGSERAAHPAESAKAQGKHVAGRAPFLPVLSAACVFLSAPAPAEVYATYPDGALAEVHLLNEMTLGTAGEGTYRFETPLGPVTVRQSSTQNAPNGCCPDTLTVVDFPAGSLASPATIEVEEGETGTITVLKFEGM